MGTNVMFKPNEVTRPSHSNMTKIESSVESNEGWTDAHTQRDNWPIGRGIKIYLLQYIFNIDVLSAHVP